MRLSSERLFSLGRLLALPLQALACTWRYEVAGLEHLRQSADAGERPILCLLHGRMGCLVHYFSRPPWRPIRLLASDSRDGALISGMLRALGYDVVRGSTARGGQRALLEIMRELRRKPQEAIGLTVDGSRGPRGYCHPGAAILATRARGSILVIGASAKRVWRFPTWDRFLLPKPWARVCIRILPPITAPLQTPIELLRSGIEDLLLAVHSAGDRRMGFRDRQPLQDFPREG